ncbi:radical SAM protein [Acidithiobacillus sp.]
MLKIERDLVIMPTYQCTASCSNCGTGSSPKRKEVIALDTMKRYIDEAATLDFRIVVFSGGEATLRWRDLISAIGVAKKRHLRTRLVTNGFWAKSHNCAEKKVNELRSAGLDEINITTGQQHLRFVSMQSVVNLIGCVVSKSMDTVVNVEAKTKMEGEMIRDSLSN